LTPGQVSFPNIFLDLLPSKSEMEQGKHLTPGTVYTFQARAVVDTTGTMPLRLWGELPM
jgi:hypothetical protein